MVHASVLLLTFNRGEVDPKVQAAEARYWAKALAGLPEWAVEAACEWYRGPDNPRRHWRPVEGDIVERARIEMAMLKTARLRIEEFDGGFPTEVAGMKVFR